MDLDLDGIVRDALAEAENTNSSNDVQLLRSKILGKKGALGQALRTLGKLSPDERRAKGQEINQAKEKIAKGLDQASSRIVQKEREAELVAGRFDVTLPGRRTVPGAQHPLRWVEQDIIRSLAPLGFSVASGPLVEHDWYNFEALNIPPEHPARDMQDTFFLAPRVVLRTHTSNVQIRTMLKRKPPVRILAPGMVFRHDEVDPSHSPVFHQIEGLWVDEHATFADLRGVLRKLAVDLFGPKATIRLRPSFFPFTEPSAEVDVSCVLCDDKTAHACRVCRGSRWIEVLGAGMVDPAVLEAVGYDTSVVQGFAFGVGIERIAMLRWGVDDIRLFYENDQRFLQQFSTQSPGAW